MGLGRVLISQSAAAQAAPRHLNALHYDTYQIRVPPSLKMQAHDKDYPASMSAWSAFERTCYKAISQKYHTQLQGLSHTKP